MHFVAGRTRRLARSGGRPAHARVPSGLRLSEPFTKSRPSAANRRLGVRLSLRLLRKHDADSDRCPAYSSGRRRDDGVHWGRPVAVQMQHTCTTWLLIQEYLRLPGSNNFLEDYRISPSILLSSQMSPARIDPCILRHVAGVEQEIDIRDRNLSILHSGNHQHRSCRLTQNFLLLQRQRRERLR
jgi:hypothetical protein